MQATLEKPGTSQPKLRLMTRQEFEHAGVTGVYGPDERLELIGGEVFKKLSPQLTPHATCTHLVVREFQEVFGKGFYVRNQAPMSIGDYNEPEPDIAVVEGDVRDYRHDHPGTAIIVVEISDSTVRFDLKKKSLVYASAQIPDYWVVDLLSRVVHIHRKPAVDPTSSAGYRYSELVKYSDSDFISPLAAPHASIRVEDILP